MNIIEAMRILHDIAEILYDEDAEAKHTIGDLLAAYDALVPPLYLWPAGANWFTVDDYGDGEWHTTEPFPDDGVWTTSLHFGESQYYKMYLFPDGIDWRLCKWQRLEAQR